MNTNSTMTSETKEKPKHKKPNWLLNKFSNKKFLLRVICAGMAIQFIIIAVLLVAFIQMRKSVDLLGNRVAYLTDNTDVIVSNMDSLQEDIEETLEEENSLLASWSINMTDLDFDSNTYKVDINIVPKSYTENTAISIYFGVSEFQLEKDGYNYTGQADLPIDQSYEGNVTVLIVDGEQRSTEVLSNYDGIVNDFTDVISGELVNMPEYSDGILKLNAECDYDLDGGDNFKFDQFELAVLANGQEVGAYDLMHESDTNLFEEGEINSNKSVDTDEDDASDDASSDDASTSADKETDKITMPDDASDASDTASDLDDSDTEETEVNPIGRISGRYNSNESYEIEAGANIRIILRATTTEGYVFVYDLFNGKLPSETELEADDAPELTKGFVQSDNFFKKYAYVYDAKGGQYTIKTD